MTPQVLPAIAHRTARSCTTRQSGSKQTKSDRQITVFGRLGHQATEKTPIENTNKLITDNPWLQI